MRTSRSAFGQVLSLLGAFVLFASASASAKCTAHSRDSDHDGVPNCLERQLGTGPRSADTDHDGLSDGLELSVGTDPTSPDSDGDGESDGMEEAQGRDPMDADENETEGPEVKIRSPLDAVDPTAETVTVLGGRLTIDASRARIEGAADLADLKAQLDAAGAAGGIGVEIRVDQASLAGTGLLVADKVEVRGSSDGEKVRCCKPGDEGANECKETSMGECAADGGLDLGPGSCEPNPCP